MDFPAQILILALVIVGLLLFIVTGVENTVPLFVRSRFDDICNNYLALMEKSSGLGVAEKNALTAELDGLGIANITVTAPTRAEWGEKVTLKVEGEYVFRRTDPLSYSKKEASKRINYENSTIALCLGDSG